MITIITVLFWMFIGFIKGTIIYWWVINPIEIRKENYEMFLYLAQKYTFQDFRQYEKESLKDYNLRLTKYMCIDTVIREKERRRCL